MLRAAVFLMLICSTGAAAQSLPIAGRATVVDGDTLQIGNTRVRLFGIDAVESGQTCITGATTWACGSQATASLRTAVIAKSLVCERKDTDDYGRTVAVCRAGGLDVGAQLVEAGWAIALRSFSHQYVGLEEVARERRKGIWSSTFTMPADFRAESAPRVRLASLPARRTQPAAARSPRPPDSASSCGIKGNHSPRGEWIYHLPGSEYYSVTRAEAYFCSEAQAVAAGYRRARTR